MSYFLRFGFLLSCWFLPVFGLTQVPPVLKIPKDTIHYDKYEYYRGYVYLEDLHLIKEKRYEYINELRFRDYPRDTSDLQYVRKLKNITTINLNFFKEFPKDSYELQLVLNTIKQIIACFPTINTVKIVHFYGEELEEIPSFFPNTTFVKNLWIDQVMVTNDYYGRFKPKVSKQFKNDEERRKYYKPLNVTVTPNFIKDIPTDSLESLTLQGSNAGYTYDYGYILRHCKRLDTLTISGSLHNLKEADVEAKQIKYLSIYTEDPVLSFESFSCFPSLKGLNLIAPNLSRIPKGLEETSGLKKVSISVLKLKYLSPKITIIDSLAKIDFPICNHMRNFKFLGAADHKMNLSIGLSSGFIRNKISLRRNLKKCLRNKECSLIIGYSEFDYNFFERIFQHKRLIKWLKKMDSMHDNFVFR